MGHGSVAVLQVQSPHLRADLPLKDLTGRGENKKRRKKEKKRKEENSSVNRFATPAGVLFERLGRRWSTSRSLKFCWCLERFSKILNRLFFIRFTTAA
jgi:hypothetical protein